MDGPRKRVNKYGRGGRKALIHDLFDVASQPNSQYKTLRPSPIGSLSPSRGQTPVSDLSEDPDVSMQLNNELLKEWDSNRPRLRSPARKTAPVPTKMAATMFEIESSDEEPVKTKPMPKTYKRRKLTPTGSDVETKDTRGQTPDVVTSVGLSGGDQQPSLGIVDLTATDKARGPQPGQKQYEGKAKKNSKPGSLAQHSLPPKSNIKSTTIYRPSTPPPLSPSDIGSPASDISTASMVTTRSASKRKREAVDGATSDISSPSQLELSSLRLTPQRTAPSRPRSPERDDDDDVLMATSPPKVRRRLIDRLEGPATKRVTDHGGQNKLTAGSKESKRTGSKRANVDIDPPAPPASTDRENSQGQNDTVKPKKYGKQRSHIRDMLVESGSQASSQRSLDDLVSQVDALPSSQQSQLEFDTSDDDDDGVHLKSIHELRQAGAVNRFDRDLDSLLEDIASETRGVRIAGLMQLVRKLKEQAFKRHLLDRGKVGKLADLIRADYDIITASIMLLALWTLAHSESATGQVLAQLYDGVLRLPADLIRENRPLSTIAKDRKENLSKALIRDLLQFESHVLGQSAGASRQTNHIIISRIAIRAIEVMLRRLLGLGEHIAATPSSWLQAAISSIRTHLNAIRDEDLASSPEHVESIRLILAWLELSEASAGAIGNTLSDAQISECGQVLAELLTWARQENVSIEHSCLKLAIELSNQKGSAAELLALAGFGDGAFAVVEEHFPKLADKAVAGSFRGEGDVDSDKLSSVILALGSLLDIVDSSENVRLNMTDDRAGQGSQVDQLVNFFKLYVDETDEVSTTVSDVVTELTWARPLTNPRRRY